MSTGNKFNRGDVVLLPISFVSGVGTVKAEHLDTVDQRDIVRKIGQLSVPLLVELDHCMRRALGIA